MAKEKTKTTPAAKVTAPAKAPAAPKAAKAPKAPKAAAAKAPGIEKKYAKDRSVCKVTFTLPKEAAFEAQSVCLMGEFNNWAQDAHPLKQLKSGDFAVTVELEPGRSYRFRYIIDGWKYENDWGADRYEPNPYGGEDSVVDV